VKVAFGSGANQDSPLNLAEIIRILSGADERAGGRARIAVVPAQGGISMGSGGLFEGGIAEKALNKTLRRLAREDAVKAVVLRIDSPGGSALASDLIWHELMELRKKKPVIASVGNMAASGGYYMACGASRVIAEATSIVGSIGVVGGKIVFAGLLDELGVDSVTFAASPAPGAVERAAYLSPLTSWDDATRERVRREMQSIYDLFIQRCATGRAVPAERIRASAEGRIFSGLQGKERGLVDEIGGLERALSVARELGKLDADAPVVVEGAAESLLELLMMDEGANESEVARAAARLEARHKAMARLVPRRAQPYFASMAPFFSGERTATALPFALLLD
jgi:protease IV